jgi:hypothetical protein
MITTCKSQKAAKAIQMLPATPRQSGQAADINWCSARPPIQV